MKTYIKCIVLLLVPAISLAQVPVDDDGNVIASYESQADTSSVGEDGIVRLSAIELQELVGPIALYPDDLLAIVLPAAAYPLQLVEAARFLDALETDPTLKPNDDWDDSIVALLNYPEVIELLNKDLDWTLSLGEAVVAQQADVVSAVEAFRDRAYVAGNLKSDSHQTVSRQDDVISIASTEEDVIYVPYYEPAEVVYYQARPVYHYYPRRYPVYYYPYDAGHYFSHGFFWGVSNAFTIGWNSRSLHVYHHSYHGHPYYGRSYRSNWGYRHPSIHVYNNTYSHRTNRHYDHHNNGDRWRVRNTRREYVRREGYARSENRAREIQTHDFQAVQRTANKAQRNEPITFRQRDARREQPLSERRHSTREQAVRQARQRTPATVERAPERVARAPARVERAPARAQRAPGRVARAPVTAQRAPARVQRSPARTERAPTRVERAPARTERAPAQTQQRQSESRKREQSSSSRASRSKESRGRSRDHDRR